MTTAVQTPAAQLVDKAFQLRDAREKLDALILANDEKLIALGKGRYEGTAPERAVNVIVPSAPEPSYKLEKGNEDRAREIAGDEFGDVFTRKVTFSPCKAFGDVVAKLFTPARAAKLLALCRITRETQSAYVKILKI